MSQSARRIVRRLVRISASIGVNGLHAKRSVRVLVSLGVILVVNTIARVLGSLGLVRQIVVRVLV